MCVYGFLFELEIDLKRDFFFVELRYACNIPIPTKNVDYEAFYNNKAPPL